MKILFVNAFEYDYLGTRVLASWLQQNGIETHNLIFEGYAAVKVDSPSETAYAYQNFYAGSGFFEHISNFNRLDQTNYALLEQCIKEENPDIIGFSARSANNFLVPRFVPIFRQAAPHALLIAGGFGPTLESAIYLQEDFDVVIRGDGEDSLLDIIKKYETGDKEAMLTIPGTIWHKKYGGSMNVLDNQRKDISLFPPPLYGNQHFSYITDGKLHRFKDPVLGSNGKQYSTYFGRGCTGNCTYCSGGQWSALYRQQAKKAYRRRNRNIDDVINECKKQSDSFEFIKFVDEYWSLPKDLTYAFFEMYKRKVGLPFFAYLNYSQMMQNQDLFDLVISAGLDLTAIGFQTGSSTLSEKCYHRKQNLNILIAYAQKLFDNFITTSYHFIGGNCYEEIDDLLQTIDLIQLLPFSIENVYLANLNIFRLCPHPNSPITWLAPRVVTHPMDAREWFYRTMCMALSQVADQEEMHLFLTNNKFHNHPHLLYEAYQRKLQTTWYQHFNELNNSNDKWIFYGAGYWYGQNKHLFTDINPDFMLLNKEFISSQYIDGIPVAAAEDFLSSPESSDYKYLVFANNPVRIQRTMLHKYSIPSQNIHSCTAIPSS